MRDFYPLLITYTNRYIENKEKFLVFMVGTRVAKQVVHSMYKVYVHANELDPIESLEIERKEQIWTRALEFTKVKKEAVMLSKCIYLFEEIIKP